MTAIGENIMKMSTLKEAQDEDMSCWFNILNDSKWV